MLFQSASYFSAPSHHQKTKKMLSRSPTRLLKEAEEKAPAPKDIFEASDAIL